MDTRPHTPSWWLLLSVGLMAVALVAGCQSIATFPGQQTGSAAATGEGLVVQVRPASGKPRNREISVTEGMRLQEVVDAVKTNFRNKVVYIVRTSPKTGERHKLEASFESNRRISLHTDYAIQPGDRVVISQDTATSFDRVMKSMFGRS